MTTRQFTSESVTSGHPDKVCDQISDAILDAIIEQDPGAHVAVETMATTGLIHVAGEVTTDGYVEIPSIVRETILGIGYSSSDVGFDGATCGVSVSIGAQSPDIASGVDKSLETRGDGPSMADAFDSQGAGDQGMMFGYACDETPELMPAPIMLAHKLARRLENVRRSRAVQKLGPDGKTQVTMRYVDGKPVGVDTVVVSTQHAEGVRQDELAGQIREAVIVPEFEAAGYELSADVRVLVNPSGAFTVGGPAADAGLTGRKIIVDTYGGMARHGGGAFSGKDPSKVDRSAAYAMRWVAKNIVAARLATRAEVQVAYAIGSAHPVGLFVDSFGTGVVEDAKLAQAVREVFDLRPAAIVSDLRLLRPIYERTASYGHFGRTEPEFTWEAVDRANELRQAAGA